MTILFFIWAISFAIIGVALYVHGHMRSESGRSMPDQMPLHPFDRPKIVNTTLEPPEDLTVPIGDLLGWARQRAAYTPREDYISQAIDAILHPKETYEPPPQPAILTAKRPLTQDQALALNQAIRNHAGVPPAILSEPVQITPVTPAEYSYQSSEHGMISGVMTPNELREKAGTVKHFARYLPDIGYVTAESKERLARACEVVLKERYDKLAEELRLQDDLLRAITETFGYNPAAKKISERERKVRDRRLEIRKMLQVVVEQLTSVNNEMLHPR